MPCYINIIKRGKTPIRKGLLSMYNYRQHDISEATARALESADAHIDALEASIREIYRDPKEWYDEEVEALYEALDKAWAVFK